MPKHLEYSAKVACTPAQAFRIMTDTERWRCSLVYGDIVWTQGEPWQPGSIRRAETLVPFRATHTQKILDYRKDEMVEMLGHGMGYLNQTQVTVKPGVEGGTEVRFSIDLEGNMALMFGMVIEEFVRRFMEVYIAELTRFCLQRDAEPSVH